MSTIDMSLVFFCFGLALWPFTILKSRVILNPLALMVWVWLVLLILSNHSINGVGIPSIETQGLTMFSLSAMVMGGMLSPNKYKGTINSNSFANSRLWLIVLFFVSLPLIWAMLKSLNVIYSQGITYFLALTRWGDGDRVEVFGSSFNLAFVMNVSRPAIIASFFAGIPVFFSNKSKALLLLSITLMLCISVTFAARGNLVTIFFNAMVLVFLPLNQKKLGKAFFSSRAKLKLVLFSFAVFLLAVYFSYVRSGGKMNFDAIILKYAIGYHTYGFKMFDIAINDENSMINETDGYGRATFSVLGLFSRQIFRFFSEPELGYARELRKEMGKQVLIGYNANDGPLLANAFYTALYPFYADFKFFGLFFFPAIYGYYLMKFFLAWRRACDNYSLAMFLFLFWTGYNSIKMPAIMLDWWWISLLFIFFTFKVKTPIKFQCESQN